MNRLECALRVQPSTKRRSDGKIIIMFTSRQFNFSKTSITEAFNLTMTLDLALVIWYHVLITVTPGKFMKLPKCLTFSLGRLGGGEVSPFLDVSLKRKMIHFLECLFMIRRTSFRLQEQNMK